MTVSIATAARASIVARARRDPAAMPPGSTGRIVGGRGHLCLGPATFAANSHTGRRAGRQSSIGSGFLVDADGLAITNYHVVSQVALEPQTYRLEYVAADGSRGQVSLLAIDLPNDLAIIRVDKHDAPFFRFDEAAMTGSLPKGERLYSMGNPLDLGFTIIEGTYNGLVEHSYNERIHFTGALNPGMSGGPTVTRRACRRRQRRDAERRRARELPRAGTVRGGAAAEGARAGDGAGLPRGNRPPARRLAVGLYKSFSDGGFRSVAFGPYQAPETTAPWFDCWSQTNAGVTPRPRASVNWTNCRSDTTCSWPAISTSARSRSAIPMSGPSISISSSSRPS